MLDALVDLISIYDDVFQTTSSVELVEEMNLIFIILNHLFKSIEVEDKLELMMNTYKRMFLNLKSSQLKTSRITFKRIS